MVYNKDTKEKTKYIENNIEIQDFNYTKKLLCIYNFNLDETPPWIKAGVLELVIW